MSLACYSVSKRITMYSAQYQLNGNNYYDVSDWLDHPSKVEGKKIFQGIHLMRTYHNIPDQEFIVTSIFWLW